MAAASTPSPLKKLQKRSQALSSGFPVSISPSPSWNPDDSRLVMSKSSSRFWLHLDQPHRLGLQGVGVCHLEKRCLFGIAGHHTTVPTACSQVSQQCSEALHRQITGRSVCLLLEGADSELEPAPRGRAAADLRSAPRPRTGSVPTPAAGATPRRRPAGTARCELALGRLCDDESAAPGDRYL